MHELVERAKSESELERTASSEAGPGLEKRGAFTGSFVLNPFTNEQVPVYVADYVLGSYGTGAIMAVPAEDERDYAFATVYECRSFARFNPRRTLKTARTRATACT